MSGPTRATQLERYVFPAAAGGEYEPDNLQDDAMRRTRSAPLGTDGLFRWQMMTNQITKLNRHA